MWILNLWKSNFRSYKQFDLEMESIERVMAFQGADVFFFYKMRCMCVCVYLWQSKKRTLKWAKILWHITSGRIGQKSSYCYSCGSLLAPKNVKVTKENIILLKKKK